MLDQPNRNRPNHSIVVQTHCQGGDWTICPSFEKDHYNHHHPSFSNTTTPFRDACRKSHAKLQQHQQQSTPPYSIQLVTKVIYMMRHPLDTLISRFHDASHIDINTNTKNRPFWIRGNEPDDSLRSRNILFPLNRTGFLSFCSRVDEYTVLHCEVLPTALQPYVDTIPCFIDVYRYVQWYNHALALRKQQRHIPTFLFHYEDYDYNWNRTTQQLMRFLQYEDGVMGTTIKNNNNNNTFNNNHHQASSSSFRPPQPGWDRNSYFTTQQIQAIWKFLHETATDDTWRALQYYRDSIPA